MREIKFRAWHKGLKEMHTCDWMGHLDKFWSYIMADSDAFDIMQFTGLKDKNGKEIYEGDIVEIYQEGLVYPKGNVIFNDGRFLIIHKSSKGGIFTALDYVPLKIIGNIYENPELLKNDE